MKAIGESSAPPSSSDLAPVARAYQLVVDWQDGASRLLSVSLLMLSAPISALSSCSLSLSIYSVELEISILTFTLH